MCLTTNFDICLTYLKVCEIKIIKFFIVIQFPKMNFHIFLNAGSLVVGSWFGVFAGRPWSFVPGFVVLRF